MGFSSPHRERIGGLEGAALRGLLSYKSELERKVVVGLVAGVTLAEPIRHVPGSVLPLAARRQCSRTTASPVADNGGGQAKRRGPGRLELLGNGGPPGHGRCCQAATPRSHFGRCFNRTGEEGGLSGVGQCRQAHRRSMSSVSIEERNSEWCSGSRPVRNVRRVYAAGHGRRRVDQTGRAGSGTEDGGAVISRGCNASARSAD